MPIILNADGVKNCYRIPGCIYFYLVEMENNDGVIMLSRSLFFFKSPTYIRV